MHRRQLLELVGAYVLLTAIWSGIGYLLTNPFDGTAVTRADDRVAQWFVDRRTDRLNSWSDIGSHLSETWVKIGVTVIVGLVMLRLWRRWFEAAFISVALILEAMCFISITYVVGRHRPDVPRLDSSPIGSSYPSGHVAAAVAYLAIAIVVFWHTRRVASRAAMVVLSVLVPIAVGVARLYRGMHFLSDVIAGALLGVASVLAALWVMRRTPEAEVVLAPTGVESPVSAEGDGTPPAASADA